MPGTTKNMCGTTQNVYCTNTYWEYLEISRSAMHTHACTNEVMIESYCPYTTAIKTVTNDVIL